MTTPDRLQDGPPLAYSHILSAVREMPWALKMEKLAVVLDLLRFRAAGGRLTAEEIQQRVGATRAPLRASVGGVAVLPIFGVIVQRASGLAASSGAMGTEQYSKQFAEALNDPSIGTILLQIDSPGGGVYGVAEFADQIYRARSEKSIVAVADSMATSAAYWIASAAEELVVTPGGEVGSIGVYAAHEDLSRLLDAEGVTVSLISAGKYKVEGNPFEPLGEEARAALQGRVDDYYGMFVRAVAKGRGVGVEAVRNGFGEGRSIGAHEAVKLGMADRVGTFDETLSRLAGPRRSSRKRADDERRRFLLHA